MKRLSIRNQITALTLIPLLIMVISMEAFFLQARFSDFDGDLIEHGKLTAHQLSGSAEYGIFSSNTVFLQGLASNVLLQQDVRTVAFFDSRGQLLLQAVHTGNITTAEEENRQALLERARLGMQNPIMVEKGSIWISQPIVSTQIQLDDLEKPVGARQIGSVLVEMNKQNTEHRKSEILWFTVFVTALILIFPLYAIFLASRSITKPIHNLSDAVQQIAQGHFDTRVSIRHNDSQELVHLSNGINEMAKQIQMDREVLEQRIDEATRAIRKQKEDAERVSHDKSHFLAVASHDLRQPLHALGLYIAELQRQVSNDEQHYLVGQVERSVENLSSLLNALLDISKLDAGAIIPQIQVCDMASMLQHVALDYQMLASMRNIKLVVVPSDAHVRSDPILLERILTNLVSNALRYTPQNGCVMLACRHRKDFLRIEVRDNGIGISATDQANIFREFFQIAKPQLDSSKGLGLGLAIVDRLGKLLDHRIGLRSIPGKGTVFSVDVPIAQGFVPAVVCETTSTDSKPDDFLAESPLRGLRLLVVDDDDMVLRSTASILNAWGCQTTVSTSLAGVADLITGGSHWDMVISDYQLENNTTGMDVINLVQSHCEYPIPCVLISGDTGPTVLKLAAVSGYHLLHKPVKPAKLRSLLLHLLEQGGDSGNA